MHEKQVNDDYLLICNEILLKQIKQLRTPCGVLVRPKRKPFSAFFFINVFVFFFLSIFFFLSHPLIALPILVQSIVNENSNGATTGSFDGGTNQLTTVGHLSVSGHTRNYVAQYFVPTASGNYDIGLSSSSEDTVLVLYSGEFYPNTPGANASSLIDDYSGSRPPGITVGSGSCGASDPDGSYCPQISANLEGGKRYYIVVTSYSPNMTVSDGVNMYVYGSPVLIGSGAHENAKTSINRLLRLSLSDIVRNLNQVNEKFMDGAIKRHSGNIIRSRGDRELEHKVIVDGEQSNKILELNDRVLEIDWSEKKAFKSIDTTTFILESYVERQRRPGIKEHTDLNLKVAREDFDNTNQTTGISLEVQSNLQKIDVYTPAIFEHTNLLIGAYSIRSPRPDLLFESHLSTGFGKGKLKLHSGSQIWNTKFETNTLLLGGSLTGKFDLNVHSNRFKRKRVEIWPTLSIEYGLIRASDFETSFKYGAINDNLLTTAQKAAVTSLSIAPKFLFTNNSLGSEKTFTLAPRFVCRKVVTNIAVHNCGFGTGFDVFQKSTGYKFLEFSFENIGKHLSNSALIEFNFPF